MSQPSAPPSPAELADELAYELIHAENDSALGLWVHRHARELDTALRAQQGPEMGDDELVLRLRQLADELAYEDEQKLVRAGAKRILTLLAARTKEPQ